VDIRPFTIDDVPEAQLADLRHRITATKWPDPEVDPSQGVQLDVIQSLARYWSADSTSTLSMCAPSTRTRCR
jgi:hypothetical protein